MNDLFLNDCFWWSEMSRPFQDWMWGQAVDFTVFIYLDPITTLPELSDLDKTLVNT